MADVTVSDSFVAVLGPMKMEVVNISAVVDADTYTSTLQNPQFGFFVPTTDGNPLTAAVNLGISGRTITINSVDLASGDDGVLVLFGF